MTESKNPWAEIKSRASKVVPPLIVVREQARMLTESTEGVVQGSVETQQISGGDIRHNLTAVVPALDNYSVVLAYVVHGVLLYPARADRPSRSTPALQCATKEALEAALLQLLTDEDPQRIVISLIAQATATG